MPTYDRYTPEVGAVERGLEHDAVFDEQLLTHIHLHLRCGGGGEGHQRHRGEHVLEGTQPLVVRPACGGVSKQGRPDEHVWGTCS